MIAILFIFQLSVSTRAAEIGLSEFYCPFLNMPVDDSISRYLATLEKRIPEGMSGTEPLRIKAKGIKEIEAYYGGGGHGLVFRVQTDKGHAVLKLYRAGRSGPVIHENSLVPSFWFQAVLGSAGMAPKLLGVLDETEIRQLYPLLRESAGKFNVLNRIQSADMLYVASLQSLVEPIWSSKVPKPFVFSPEQRLRYEEIQRLVKILRISADDTDIIVTREGQVMLIDLDSYAWVSRGGKTYSEAVWGKRRLKEIDIGLWDRLPKDAQ